MFAFIPRFYKCSTRNIHIKSRLHAKKRVIIPHVYNMIAMQQKKKLQQYSHYSAKLMVVGSGAVGTPASVFLITDHINYIFNCGEGIQRLSQEYRIKLSKLSNIFLTQNSWKNIGGVPGVLLTARSNGLTDINIHGPEGIQEFIDKIKMFTYMPNMKISFISSDVNYQDGIINVITVPIMKTLKDVEENSSDLVNEIQYRANENGKRVVDDETQEDEIKRLKMTPSVLCYVCEINPRPGKLLVNRCIQLGIPPGPLLNKLKQGVNVTKPDGTIVYSKDVLEPKSNKTTFIVAECPSEEYLDSFVNHPTLSNYQNMAKSDNDVICVFHFTPEKIFTSQQYRHWLSKFSPKVEHVILNNENTCMGSEAVYKNQVLLNLLHPEIFPLLKKDCFEQDKQTGIKRVHRARALQELNMRPIVEKLREIKIHEEKKKYISQVYTLNNFGQVLEKLRININEKSAELNLNNISDYPRIVMLGTGCSVPSKIRNTSSILLRITADTSILLDCGENTLAQLIRFYGSSEYLNILRTIKAIYVSHIHADHHLGLIDLLLKRKTITEEKLYLLVPNTIISWLDFCNKQFGSIKDQYFLIYNNDLFENRHKLDKIDENKLYDKLKIKQINTIFVPHCFQSFGVAIILNDNKKITYSGDTKFSESLINLGQNCDLLIHEATMEDGLEKVAKDKAHSTTSQAINAGKSMNAKYILLTHFSQRYSKLPSIPDKEANVGVAYDFMEFKLPQLPLIPLFYPCLKLMFNEYNKVMNK